MSENNFVPKPFGTKTHARVREDVEIQQVTFENFWEIASWAGTYPCSDQSGSTISKNNLYLEIRRQNAGKDQPFKARIGDYLVKDSKDFLWEYDEEEINDNFIQL